MQVPVEASKQEAVKAAIDEVVEALAPKIVHIRSNFGEDWMGNPALFFRVLLSDEASKDENLHPTARRVYQLMDERMDALDLNVHSHFNFRSLSEQRNLKDTDWA